MGIRKHAKRFFASTDGYVITSERIMILTMVTTLLVVGLIPLRIACLNEFLDEVNAIAARTNGHEFGNGVMGGATYRTMFTDDFTTRFPDLSGPMNVWPPASVRVEPPSPIPASNESD